MPDQFTTLPINYGRHTKRKIANNMPSGTSLTEKLIDCIDSLPENSIIEAYDGDPVSENIVLKAGQKLLMVDGDWELAQGKRFVMRNGSIMDGNNRRAVIWQPHYNHGTPGAEYLCVVGEGAHFGTNGTGGDAFGQFRSVPSYNLAVRGLTFKGLKNTVVQTSAACVGFFNTHNGIIENCLFDTTMGYACQFGQTPGSGAITNRALGQFGENLRFTQNLVKNCMSQNIGVISCENTSVDNNIFQNPGGAAYLISSITAISTTHAEITLTETHTLEAGTNVAIQGVTGGGWTALNNDFWEGVTIPAGTPRNKFRVPINASGFGVAGFANARVQAFVNNGSVIDFEVSAGTGSGERFVNTRIVDNTIDMRDGGNFSGGIAINVATNPTPFTMSKMIEVSRNMMYGHETGGGRLTFGIGLHYELGAQGVTKANVNFNHIEGTINQGIELSGTDVTAVFNKLINCTTNGSVSQLVCWDLTNSNVSYNEIRNTDALYQAEKMELKGTCTRLNVFGNTIGGYDSPNYDGKLFHATGSTVTHCHFKDNTVLSKGVPGSMVRSGDIIESANSNFNRYEGNYTGMPEFAGRGLHTVGANNFIHSHFYSDGTSILGAASSRVVTGATDTLTRLDNGAVVIYTGDTDIVVTVPAGLGALYNVTLIQRGAGAIIPTAAGGGAVTIGHRLSHTKSAGNPSVITLFATTANTYVLAGDTA